MVFEVYCRSSEAPVALGTRDGITDVSRRQHFRGTGEGPLGESCLLRESRTVFEVVLEELQDGDRGRNPASTGSPRCLCVAYMLYAWHPSRVRINLGKGLHLNTIRPGEIQRGVMR